MALDRARLALLVLSNRFRLLRTRTNSRLGDDIPRSVSPNTTYNIDSGKWDAMEKVWRRAFRDLLGDDPKLGGDLKECPVHLAERPLNPRSDREKTTEIMFEKFEVPALYLSMQAVLALYASGRTTGIVLDSGDGFTHAVPISDCYAITPAITQLDFAGRNLTEFLVDNLKWKFDHKITNEIGRDIKEKCCRVALDSEEFSSASKETYTLPDGKSVNIGDERFCTPEALFQLTFRPDPKQPNFLIPDPKQSTSFKPFSNQPVNEKPDESKIVGIHGVIHESISKLKCSKLDRTKMYGNVVLSGGTTMFPGIDKRLEKELTSLLEYKHMAGTKVRVH
ncbi:hypothetical protein AX17_005988 [Amanita inopinata Kibby_2008]|nr:hypothetical protein AX17_005988 [Amanita inopinata Kibby_2008]